MPSYLRNWLHSRVLSNTLSLSAAERWKASLGALLCIAACGLLLRSLPLDAHWLLAPVGASVVILFVQFHSPLAQPWPVLGSYLVATLAGLACSHWVSQPALAAALAVALSIWLMAWLNCVHPPGGALALLLVLNGPYNTKEMLGVSELIAINAGALLVAALVINRLILRRNFPFGAAAQGPSHRTKDQPPIERMGLTHIDLESAVKGLNTFVDVQEDELVEIYNLAVDHAFGRHVGLTCADIMSRDVVTAHFDTELAMAWQLLRKHKIKSLPVIDRFDRLIGIVTVADFLRQIDGQPAPKDLATLLQALLRRTPGHHADKPEVVGQIMTPEVFTATPQTPLSELIRQISQRAIPHVPIIDARRKVVGMVTQSDLLVALYKSIALDQASRPAVP
ncbi:CBS domain-containing protein [Acidovorax sp. DW039]|uniref:HPP family protein n=1 Tax=Acidovorax sp. DW039 TaxID=3095606 RepID=UPI00308F2A26|nr:CBS domain-containing protein [Acidovorax sp. DW039]